MSFGNVEPSDSQAVIRQLQEVVAALKANREGNREGAVSLAALRDEIQRRKADHV